MIFNYTISSDTLNGKVSSEKLSEEIQDSTITTALEGITANSLADTLAVEFKASLSAADQITIASLVAAHDGLPSVDDPIKTVWTDNDGNPVGTVDDGGIKRLALDFGGVSLVGAQGVQGDPGPQGTQGDPGPTSVFGTFFQMEEEIPLSSTTSSNYQNKLTLTTTSLPSGQYYIQCSYRWDQSNTSDDFSGRLHLNNTTELFAHQQEPKDTGANQKTYFSWFGVETLSGINTLDVDFREQRGNTASIAEVRVIIWRIN